MFPRFREKLRDLATMLSIRSLSVKIRELRQNPENTITIKLFTVVKSMVSKEK